MIRVTIVSAESSEGIHKTFRVNIYPSIAAVVIVVDVAIFREARIEAIQNTVGNMIIPSRNRKKHEVRQPDTKVSGFVL